MTKFIPLLVIDSREGNNNLTTFKPGCGECVSACCRNVELPLSTVEAESLRSAGTTLDGPLEEPSLNPGKDRQFYHLIGRCANVVDRDDGSAYCGAYDARPAVCREVPFDGPTCRAATRTVEPILPKGVIPYVA